MSRTEPGAGDTGAVLGEYISEHAFAAELNVCIRTVRQWRALGDGPAITRVGRRVLYARADIRAWLLSQRREVA